MKRTTRLRAAALAGSADQASRPTFDVKVGKLVLTRISGHYHGALAVTAHYRGRTAAADAVLSITVPAGLRLSRANTGGPCLLGVPVRCFFGTPFQPGERRGFTIELDSYAGPDRHARITADGLIAVSTGATDPGGAAAFRGILLRGRRTGGRQPRRQLRNLARDHPLTKAPARERTGSGDVVGRRTRLRRLLRGTLRTADGTADGLRRRSGRSAGRRAGGVLSRVATLPDNHRRTALAAQLSKHDEAGV